MKLMNRMLLFKELSENWKLQRFGEVLPHMWSLGLQIPDKWKRQQFNELLMTQFASK